MFLRILLVGLHLSNALPVGTFMTRCHERHFWLSVKASFLGSMMQFKIQDRSGIHVLSSQRAAECGYTVILNHRGDLLLRASYLACYVDNKKDTDFRLHMWFINKQTDGSVHTYPLMLHCSLAQPWSMREIVCEENYMEISIQWSIPLVTHEGVKWIDLQSKMYEDKSELLRSGHVIFYRPGLTHETPWPIQKAEVLGFRINTTDTRMVLRSAYSSYFSYVLKEQDIHVDALTAIIIFQFGETSIPVEISMACAKTGAINDGTHLLWTFPLALSPLVHGWFRNKEIRLGLDGKILNGCEIHESGYKVTLKDQTVRIRVPTETEEVQLKSHVINGQYAQSLSAELFFMYHWEDAVWPHTQHRSFRLLNTPYVPRTPTLINNTSILSNVFSIKLGVFAGDVSLQNITVAGATVTWAGAQPQGLYMTHIPFRNGSHAYAVQIPFSHPLIIQKDKKRILALTFNFIILPEKEYYSYSTDVIFEIKEKAPLGFLEGRCTERGIMVILHHGSEDTLWELYLGGHKLDWDLVRLGNYRFESGEDRFSVEIPLYSPGMSYEDLNLKDLIAKVEVSAVNVATLKVEHLVQRCTFPVRDLLVCLPEGRMVVVTDTTRSIPPIRPNSTTLLDPSCRPTATDSTRALFNFSLNSCGTTVTVDGNYLLYENQVRYRQNFLPKEEPLIHMDSPFRLTLQCRYPVNDTRTLTLEPHRNSTISWPSLPQSRRSVWIRRYHQPFNRGRRIPRGLYG